MSHLNKINSIACKQCSTPLIYFTNDKESSNVSKSQFNRYTSYCKECFRKRNAKNNPKNNQKIKEQKHMETKENILIQRKEKYITLEKIDFNYTDWITFNEQFISNKTLQGLDLPLLSTFLESPMGTSKTTAVIYYARLALSKGLRVAYLTPNLVTIQETKKKLEEANVPSVTHHQYERFFDDDKVVLSTIEGGIKYNLTEFDVLILDEAKSITEDIGFKSMNDFIIDDSKYGIYNKLKDHKCLIALDSDLTYLELIYTPERKVKNLFRKQKDIRIHQGNYKDFIKEIKYQISQSPESEISIQIDNLKLLNSIKENLINTGFITKEETQVWTAKDPNTLIQFNTGKYKFSSPKIARGVSITADLVFIKDDGKANPYTIYQMVDRARDSKMVYLMLSKDDDRHKREYETIINRYKAENTTDHGLYRYAVNNNRLDRTNYIKFLIGKTYDIKVTKDGSYLSDITTSIGNHIQQRKHEIQGLDYESKFIFMYKSSGPLTKTVIINELIKEGNTHMLSLLL